MKVIHWFFVLILLGSRLFAASELEEQTVRKAESAAFVMEHITDAHDFHIWGEGSNSMSLPLPVILWSDEGLHFFMSNAFHHDNSGKYIVQDKNKNFVQYKTKIYALNKGEKNIKVDKDGQVVNAVLPLDFSFSKHAFSMTFVAFLLFFVLRTCAKNYEKTQVPKGINGFFEPIILFVRDEIARPNLGYHADRFLPYLLTAFFFILFNNLFGLIPFFPGSSNVTGDVAVTFTLAVATFLVVNISANKDYWKHIFAMPGLPVWLLPIMIPIEIVGIFSKPFALMVRLAVNISAGHIIILSLISLIFTFKSVVWAGFSVPFALVMNSLELLVAFLQAYVFTLLSALFIGMATEEHEH